MKCKANKKNGEPCKGKALTNGYCFAHAELAEVKKPDPAVKLYKVKATTWYHNGAIPHGTNWKNEEVREVDANTLRLLREDAPRNWTILDA